MESSGDSKNTIYVDSAAVRRIIGKGGANIRDLESRSEASIKVSRDRDGDQVAVNVFGNAEQVAMATKLIEDISLRSDYDDDQGRGGPRSSETIQVDSRDVGRIIGSRGSRVRQLQDDSGAKIDVSRDNRGSKVDVEISGTPEQIAKAKQYIQDELSASDYSNGYDGGDRGGSKVTTTMHVDSGDVGRIIGSRGSKVRQLQDESGARIDVSRDKSGSKVPVEISGREGQVARAKELIQDILDSSDDRGPRGGRGGGGRGGEEEVMEVDSGDVGKIIGRYGARIRELQDESGAYINVSRERAPMVPVTISGTKEEIRRARELIEEILAPGDYD